MKRQHSPVSSIERVFQAAFFLLCNCSKAPFKPIALPWLYSNTSRSYFDLLAGLLRLQCSGQCLWLIWLSNIIVGQMAEQYHCGSNVAKYLIHGAMVVAQVVAHLTTDRDALGSIPAKSWSFFLLSILSDRRP